MSAMPGPVSACAAGAGRLDGLQGLRGLAAAAVVLTHLAEVQNTVFAGARVLPGGLGLGWFGVDIFFVLSGFIIARSTMPLAGGARVSAGFLAARFARVFPPWWGALAMMAGFLILAPGLIGYHGDAGALQTFFLLPSLEQPLLSIGWTLVLEIWFYSAFAALLLAPARFRPAALIAWTLAVLAASGLPARPHDPVLTVIANPLTLEFLMGAGIAMTVRPVRVRGLAIFSGAAAMVLIVAGAAIIHLNPMATPLQSEWQRVTLVGLPAALLVAAVATIDLATPPGRRGPVTRAMAALGDRSYSLYLVHYPLVWASARLVAPVDDAMTGAALAILLALLASALVTEILHRLVERPAISLSHQLRAALAARPSGALRQTA